MTKACLVDLVSLVHLVYLVNEMNEKNQIDRTNEIDDFEFEIWKLEFVWDLVLRI
jgi:hypothetical protein